MKRTYLTIIISLMAFLLAACGIEELYFECDGFYIAPYTEDIGEIPVEVPIELPINFNIRITDSQGAQLYSGTFLSISAEGILTTNGGFHSYSHTPASSIINIFLEVPDIEEAEELVGSIVVNCESTARPFIYFTDDRIGPDTATTLNAYRQNNGLMIYSENNGSFLVTFDAINAAGNPAENTLISSHNGVDVYLLSDGLIQIMETVAPDGKRDILIIDLDDEGLVTRWRRGTFNTLTGETNIHSQTDGWDGYPTNF